MVTDKKYTSGPHACINNELLMLLLKLPERCYCQSNSKKSSVVGHVDIAKLLLNAGADLSQTVDGKTACEIAVDFDNLDIADLIKQHTSS